jgi:hypothetical protein
MWSYSSGLSIHGGLITMLAGWIATFQARLSAGTRPDPAQQISWQTSSSSRYIGPGGRATPTATDSTWADPTATILAETHETSLSSGTAYRSPNQSSFINLTWALAGQGRPGSFDNSQTPDERYGTYNCECIGEVCMEAASPGTARV